MEEMNAKECADKLRWWAERFSPRSEQWAPPAAKDLRAAAHIIEALIEERHYLGASAERANAERAKLESELFAVLHRALNLPDDGHSEQDATHIKESYSHDVDEDNNHDI